MRFIYTNDLNTKNILLSLGYKLLKCNDNKIWVFENDDKLLLSNETVYQFTKTQKEKIVFSDILTF